MRKFCHMLFASTLLTMSTLAETVDATAHIAFKGTSTLHDFEGTVATQPFAFTFQEDPATGQISLTAKAVLNVADMNTQNKKRDKNMFKMLDKKHFNLISGSLSKTSFPASGSANAKLKLKIRNVERDVKVSLSNWKREGNKVSVHMGFSVSLASFGLKPPSVMGIIRVGDTVTVECEVVGTCK